MKDNKLKVYKMVDEYYCDDSFCILPSDVYIKSEADECIESLRTDYKDACGKLHTVVLIKDELYHRLQHANYKRCLAMAKWCNERYILDVCLYELGKTRFYERWENRWINIAAQFKEAK